MRHASSENPVRNTAVTSPEQLDTVKIRRKVRMLAFIICLLFILVAVSLMMILFNVLIRIQ